MVPTHALYTLCVSPHPGLVSLLFMPSLYSLFLIRRIFNVLVDLRLPSDSITKQLALLRNLRMRPAGISYVRCRCSAEDKARLHASQL